jgi:hypothetical protein
MGDKSDEKITDISFQFLKCILCLGVMMSPTVFYQGKYRFFFFSREESRIHVHIESPDGEAKFWLEPIPSIAENYGFSPKELTKLLKHVQENAHEIKRSWKKHFNR